MVLITGGSSGIGKALVMAFGREGYRVAFTGRDAQRLQETTAQATRHQIHCLSILADAASEADSQRAVDETILHFGRLDVLICNAGISMRALFDKVDLSVLRKLLDTNFWGTVYAAKYALPYLVETRGSLVGVSSIAGYRGLPGRTGYSASKFAMQGFLEALRTELLPKGVHVLVACPGFTASNIRQTALTESGTAQGESPRAEEKMMSAEEVAQNIVRAVKNRKRDLVLTFQGKLTVWLNRLLPGVADKLVYKHMAKEENSPFV